MNTASKHINKTLQAAGFEPDSNAWNGYKAIDVSATMRCVIIQTRDYSDKTINAIKRALIKSGVEVREQQGACKSTFFAFVRLPHKRMKAAA